MIENHVVGYKTPVFTVPPKKFIIEITTESSTLLACEYRKFMSILETDPRLCYNHECPLCGYRCLQENVTHIPSH